MIKQFDLQKKHQEYRQNMSNYFLEYYFKEKISHFLDSCKMIGRTQSLKLATLALLA